MQINTVSLNSTKHLTEIPFKIFIDMILFGLKKNVATKDFLENYFQ